MIVTGLLYRFLASLAVEEAGAHPLLTDAVNLLTQAKEKVADFVELPTEVIHDE